MFDSTGVLYAAPHTNWTEVLQAIKRDPRYLEGITYGIPRPGHDEGSVKNHIDEMERTLCKINSLVDETEFAKLLVLIHAHDTFKLAGKRLTDDHQVSLRDPHSHPMLARAFLSEFTSDESVLSIAQWHDEGHALWIFWNAKKKINTRRLKEMLDQIPDLSLFLLFTVLDGWTESKLKDRSPLWFINAVQLYFQPPGYPEYAIFPRPTARAYDAIKLLEDDRARTIRQRVN